MNKQISLAIAIWQLENEINCNSCIRSVAKRIMKII